ncbi:MAG: Ig-like domain-containing protein, partial [Clostridia bacterium]|nr:Ig-like domain-containing protein [Clostridia bacterium]
TPVVSVGENGEVDWEAIPHASGYSIDVNGTVFAYEFDFFLMEGETVRVKALGDGVTYSDSDWSTAVTFSSQGSEPTKLATPQVTVSEQGVASWAAIANASGYKFKLNGGAEESTNALSVTLTSGQSIVVKAVGDGTSFSDSDWSASVTYTAGQSDTKLATPVVTINADGVASWAAVAHSWGYKYKVDGGEEQSTSARSVTLQGGQSIQVKAVGNGSTYTDSDWSQVKTYDAIPKLATPVVSIADDGTASWEAVEHATGYRYKISGGAEQFTSAFSVVLTDGQSIVVKAVFDGADYEESGWSAYTVYNAPVPTLATPEPYFASGCMGVLRWEAVEGAQSYKVHWYSTMWTAQERIDTRTNPSFCRVLATNEYCATDDNNPSSLEYYEYEVMALSDGTDCADSDWSTPVGFSVKAVGAIPSLRLDDAGLAAWDPILGALEYAVTVFGLDGLYIAEYVLPADQTTFQMTANTYICVSAGRWLDGSEALYYIPDFHFGYYLTLSGAKWRLRLSPNFIDGSDISYGSMEYRVNGGEILPFDGIGIFDLDAGDVVELRRVNTDNNWRSVTVAACAHTEYRFYPLVLPTEQSAGHRAYYQCVDCGATWEYGLDFLEAYLEKYPDNHYLWTDYTEYSDYQSMRNAIDYAWDAEASTDYKSVYSDTFRPLSHREETEWLYDADEHWTITYCRNCGEYEISAERSAHVMEGGVCTVCGYRSDLLLPADMSIEEFYSYNGALTINAYYEEEYDPSLYLDDYQWGRLSGLADYIVLYEGANAVLNNEPSAYMRGWVSWGDDEGNGGTYFDYSFLYKHTDQCGYPFHAVLSFDPNKLSALPGSLLDLKDVFRASATRATVISRNGLVLVVDGANYAAGVDSIEIVAGQEIAVGATAPIDYDMTPRKDVLGTLTWTSSDESILSIDQAGNMTAHREGTVTVRVETNPFNTYT